MSDINKELFEKIIKSQKTLVNYYPYPSSGHGDVIAETCDYRSNFDIGVKSIIDLMVQLGAEAADKSADNKTAVEVKVEGLDYNVFFCRKDGRYCVTTKVNAMDGQKPLKIKLRVD